MFTVERIYYLLVLVAIVSGYKKVRFGSLQGRIVGGHKVKITEFPYMVKLEVAGESGPFLCGGTYIKPLWILTAAHCLDANEYDTSLPPTPGTEQTRVKCIMGIDDIERTQSSVQMQKSHQLFLHPDFYRDDSQVKNDIALIKLKVPFNLSAAVKTIGMPTSDMLGDEKVTIIGWGAVGGFLSGMPHQLQALETITHTKEDCARLTDSPSVICIGERGNIACSGDSGGPLVHQSYVVGVCSYGFGCGAEVAVYENVYSHREWLRNISGEESHLNPSCGSKWNFVFYSCIGFIIFIYFNNIQN